MIDAPSVGTGGVLATGFAVGNTTERIAPVEQTTTVARESVSIMPVDRLWDQQDRHAFPKETFCPVGMLRAARIVRG
ncbi:MAG: hypothetical protein KDA86_15625 [Planctomycetaceae bacterium]|nr:hypothetical protein [Planctomycetaceae bacterium]